MLLSLVPKEMCDLHGLEYRHVRTLRDFQLRELDPKYFKDHGLVVYHGHEYYMGTYNPPVKDEDN